MQELIERAVGLIRNADGLLITAGAGMGVDSGLPDFRGGSGFWKAYPALAGSGIDFTSIANPNAFRSNPQQAWGFYGHRLNLYREAIPHSGFAILKEIGEHLPQGAFVITSNVDGQFQKAGFAGHRILEIHGSIHHLQCCEPCCWDTWTTDELVPDTDDTQCLWLGKLPHCIHCGKLARPNILMFNDFGWASEREEIQRHYWKMWQASVQRMVVIECGAGLAIPSIRRMSESQRCPVIRINPREPALPEGRGVSLPLGAKQALDLIAEALREQRQARRV